MITVCLTSNAYHNCLVPFAYYWNKFTSDEEFGTYPVTVACYEAPLPDLPSNFDVLRIGKQDEHTWSSGLTAALERINEDVILLMLEDYWLTEKVSRPDLWRVHQLITGQMAFTINHASSDEHETVVKIDLTDDRMRHEHRPFGEQTSLTFVQSADDAAFQTSLQAAFWRKDFLLRFLDPAENAWRFEKAGTRRVIAARQTGEFKGLVLGNDWPLLRYANAVGGEGHKPGVIEPKHMPAWMWEECVAKGWAR